LVSRRHVGARSEPGPDRQYQLLERNGQQPAGMRWWTGSCTCPNAGTGDRPRCRKAGIPDTVAFQTKPQLARMMLARALDAGYRPRGCVPTRSSVRTGTCGAGWKSATWRTCGRSKCNESLQSSSRLTNSSFHSRPLPGRSAGSARPSWMRIGSVRIGPAWSRYSNQQQVGVTASRWALSSGKV
jgi:hypothetical protein